MSKYNEILKLRDMLSKAHIPYTCEEFFNGYVIHYPEWDNGVCSVIEHDGSYGHTADLLEICGLLTEEEQMTNDVRGFITADEVFKRIEKHFRESEVN